MGRGSSKQSGGGGKFNQIQDAKEFKDMLDAEDFFGSNWIETLSQGENISLYSYTDDGYQQINQYLRHGVPADDEAMNDIANLDSAIAKSVIRSPIVVKRGSTAEMFGFDADAKVTELDLSKFVGRTFHDKGFVSTTAGGTSFLDTIEMRITVPAGRGRGGYIGTESAHPAESEFLIKRNASFRVTGVGKNNYGIPVVSVQML